MGPTGIYEKQHFVNMYLFSRQYPPVHTAVVPAAAPTLDTIGGAEDGTWVGPSSCDQFTTALGSGQRVVAYSFYVPKW